MTWAEYIEKHEAGRMLVESYKNEPDTLFFFEQVFGAGTTIRELELLEEQTTEIKAALLIPTEAEKQVMLNRSIKAD